MTDNVQAGTQTGSGPTFGSFNTAGGVDHAASVLEYVTTLSAGANVLQPVQMTSGLPVQPGTGTVWAISGSVTAAVSNFPAGFLAAQSGAWSVAQSGAWTVTANAGTNLNTSTLALEAGGNLAAIAGAVSAAKMQTNVALVGGTAAATGNGTTGAGTLRVTISSDSAGQVTLASGANLVGAVNVAAAASGGYSTYYLGASANSVNATVAKASAGQLYGLEAFNYGTTIVYLKFYNKATSPTVGTDAVFRKIPIPPASAAGQVGGVLRGPMLGIVFSAGISFGITNGFADTDSTAVAAGQVSLNLDYK